MKIPLQTSEDRRSGCARTPYLLISERWVAPFGNPRINDCSHLPAAYRSVPRPSSPLPAKAFTKCPYTLEFFKTTRRQTLIITSMRSTILSDLAVTEPTTRKQPGPCNRPRSELLYVFTMSKNAAPIWSVHGAKGAETNVLTIRNKTLSKAMSKEWWAREDLNFRPHPYQGCALTS